MFANFQPVISFLNFHLNTFVTLTTFTTLILPLLPAYSGISNNFIKLFSFR